VKISVRYQSRGGNTKAVAEAIAKIAGAAAEPIDVSITESVDVLFVGGGIYAWDIDKKLKAYLHSLNPDLIKSVAVFTTGTIMSGTEKIAAIAKERRIIVNPNDLPFKAGLNNYHLFGGKGTLLLSQNQLDNITEFVMRVTKK
jgi:menaquinone-dependent protoporphyrinogen IX oxidase